VCYYTVQFIHPSVRQKLIDKLYKSLNWGGALLLFEKVRGPDARFQDLMTSLYTDYKIRVGYTPSDIVAKSRSLKGILEPFSTQGNIDMLGRAGFVDINTLQKYICFEGFIANK
jgi:tRNA (cmo5U34)-methyltransferase